MITTFAQSVRKADQRLVLDSKNAPVGLAGAITSHRFILFSDILIDIGTLSFFCIDSAQ